MDLPPQNDEMTINLHDFYNGCTDILVEAPREVVAALEDSRREEANSRRRCCYHKAYYSLDLNDGIELRTVEKAPTPEELLEKTEQTSQLYAALGVLSKKQARRVYHHYFLGKSKTEIARAEGVSESSVFESIQGALVKMRKYLRNL